MASATPTDGMDSVDSLGSSQEVTHHENISSESSSSGQSCDNNSVASSEYETAHSDFSSDEGSDVWGSDVWQSCDEGSPDGSSDDDLYCQDYFPDLHKANEILKNWKWTRARASEVTVTESEPSSPDSPPVQVSEEYEAIEANARAWKEALEELVAKASQPSSSYPFVLEGIDHANARDFATPGSSLCQHNDMECTQSECSQTSMDKVHDIVLPEPINTQNVKGEHLNSRRPPAFLATLLNKAEEELMSDISKLPYQRLEILSKPAVTDKFFPLGVYKKMCCYPDLLKGFKEIRALEVDAMPERLSVTVMAARIGQTSYDEESHDPAPPPQGSTPDNSDSAAPENRLPTSIYAMAQESPLPRAVDLLRNIDDPATPNPSPALSNDAGESLGNLTHLTERLEVVHDRADEAGVVPQTRFASPALWGGANIARQGSTDSYHTPSPLTIEFMGVETAGPSDPLSTQSPQLAQPLPLRPAQHQPTILQESFRRASSTQGGDSRPPRPKSSHQLACSDEEEEKKRRRKGRQATAEWRRKRHNSEANAKDIDADKKDRDRYDSLWDRKGDEDRKGSGAGGALSG